jgi:quercetin dioxygenase-like cupin family protein
VDKSRIHITPTDILADIDEIPDGSEPRSRCKYYIEPYGTYGLNEVCEANYYPGNRVPYHEHKSGFETFLVDNGAIEILTLSKKAAAKKGDIVHITPYTPHSIHALEENSIWRAFHQGLWLTDFMIDERALRDRHWDTFFDPEFKKDTGARNGSAWFDYLLPECRDVPASEIPCLRPYDFALAEYAFEGLTLKLKVGRWETLGAKEVWQLRFAKGYKLSWEKTHPSALLYDVFSGSVRVTLEGKEPFTARARDLLHIPKFYAGSIETLEDTVLLDMGCQGFLTRFMDELNTYKIKEPAKLKDRAFLRELMRKNDYHVLFESL